MCRQVRYRGRLTPALNTIDAISYPTFTGPRIVFKMFSLRISQHLFPPKIRVAAAKPPNLGQSRCRLHRSDHRMCRRSGARVSAPLRRGAAPYADGCERFPGHSHLISLLLFAVLSDLRRGFYVTFRDTQCTIKSTLQYTF